MNPENSVHGGCLCGAVRFMLELPSKWCAHCHCTMCRKYHGAGYVTWVGFEQKHFTLGAGENELRWHESSPGAFRGFCSHCGSSLLFRSERWAGEIHVALGCLDDEIDRKPSAHVYHDTRVDWVVIDEALKLHDPN